MLRLRCTTFFLRLVTWALYLTTLEENESVQTRWPIPRSSLSTQRRILQHKIEIPMVLCWGTPSFRKHFSEKVQPLYRSTLWNVPSQTTFGFKNGYSQESSQKYTPRATRLAKNKSYLFLRDKWPGYACEWLLCLAFNRFWLFFFASPFALSLPLCTLFCTAASVVIFFTQTCMSCVGIGCTTGGTRRRQVLLDPQMAPPCIDRCSSIPRCRPAYRNSWAGMTRWASTGLARNHAAAPGADWLRYLALAHSISRSFCLFLLFQFFTI